MLIILPIMFRSVGGFMLIVLTVIFIVDVVLFYGNKLEFLNMGVCIGACARVDKNIAEINPSEKKQI